MNIIIVGCGKVGYAIAKELLNEKGVDITIVDNKPDVFDMLIESIDVLYIKGNGLNANTLIEAGVKNADLLISTTEADEVNILCCISAKHLGVKHTIARVRNPEYASSTGKIWRNLGLDMLINPEQETAREISRLLRFPTVDDIDTFVGGRVEMVSFQITGEKDYFVGKSVANIFNRKRADILLAMVERDNTALIPHGDLILRNHDIIRVLGRPSEIMNFFSFVGKNTEKIKTVMIIGGSTIAYYLVELLNRHSRNTDIKIIEINKERCEFLSESFPRSLIVHGDGTDEEVLLSEDINKSEAVLCLTDRDEENTVVALYSMQLRIRKVILKINHINPKMVRNLGLGSIVSPKNITTGQIVRYVRDLSGALGSNIRTVYKIFEDNDNNRIEAVELDVGSNEKCLDIPLKELKLKKGILLGCIIRNSNIIIPSGDSLIMDDDTVIIITRAVKIQKLDDILDDERSSS